MKRFFQYCLFILVTSGATVPDVNALEFQLGQKDDKKILVLSGDFKAGDNLQFGDILRRAGRVDEIWFDSPGGNLVEGLEIGRRIRAAQLATRVPSGAFCGSSCTFAFLGGVLRYIDHNTVFAVHMFTQAGNKNLLKEVEESIKQKGSNGAKDVIMMIEQDSALAAQMQANYLLEMSISLRFLFPNYDTKHTDGHALSRREMVEYNVVNTQDY